jgi:hypothetical protein
MFTCKDLLLIIFNLKQPHNCTNLSHGTHLIDIHICLLNNPCRTTILLGSEAHPASCTMGIRGSFSRGKARPERDADHVMPRSRMSRSYTSSPPKRHMACSGTALLCFTNQIFHICQIVEKKKGHYTTLVSLIKIRFSENYNNAIIGKHL